MKWDEITWSKSEDKPTMLTRHLVEIRDWRVDLHKMVGIDAVDCLHTHPAKAWRIILWGGYCEEFIGPYGRMFRDWRPLRAGIVQPELAHRIQKLLNGRCSYSLWIRAPKTHQVQLIGEGWEGS